ncbi:hypothetical protein B5F87_16450 [Eubacterium sp. An3]|nr:hypothetical protein B5F87_16450 [Eubacterium sp. An3]
MVLFLTMVRKMTIILVEWKRKFVRSVWYKVHFVLNFVHILQGGWKRKRTECIIKKSEDKSRY